MKKSTLLIASIIAGFAGGVAIQLKYVASLRRGEQLSPFGNSCDSEKLSDQDSSKGEYIVAQSGRAPKTPAPSQRTTPGAKVPAQSR